MDENSGSTIAAIAPLNYSCLGKNYLDKRYGISRGFRNAFSLNVVNAGRVIFSP